MSTAEAIPIRSRDVLLRPDGGGVLIFQTRTDEMHYVSPEVNEVLKLCDGARTVAEICSLFVDELPERSNPEQCAPIERLIEDLANRGVVELWR